MIHGAKAVGIDTSMLLVIDPAYIFTQQEWQEEVVPRAEHYGDFPRAVLEALADKYNRPIPEIAAVVETVSDGAAAIKEKSGKVTIDVGR